MKYSFRIFEQILTSHNWKFPQIDKYEASEIAKILEDEFQTWILSDVWFVNFLLHLFDAQKKKLFCQTIFWQTSQCGHKSHATVEFKNVQSDQILI